MSFSNVDFHCHLDLYPNFTDLVNNCEKEKIYTLAVTTTPKAWPKNRDVTLNKLYVRPALGLHPQLVSTRTSELDLWEEYLTEASFVGEVGLDASPQFYSSFEQQRQVFEHILIRCDSAGGKILSVHAVRSVAQAVAMIGAKLRPDRARVVFHWFTGSSSELQKALKLGCYFSVNSEMLRSTKGEDLIGSLPLNRILTETDGPFIKSGNDPLQPGNVGTVLKRVAEIKNITVDELRGTLNANLHTLMDDMNVPIDRAFGK